MNTTSIVRFLACFLCLSPAASFPGNGMASEIRGRIVDASSGRPLAARVYLRGEDGAWRFVRSASAEGSAVLYENRSWIDSSVLEIHTTISAHPFSADVPPGRYEIIVERGKEYFPERREISVGPEGAEVEFRLRRWVDMAARGWYSGDTHLHRSVEELRNVAIAEDLNVSFPVTAWITEAFASPSSRAEGGKPRTQSALISVDPTHVLWARNTEYEIARIGEKAHMLGALIVLGHRSELEAAVPPWGPAAAGAVADGALLDIEKFDWYVSPLFPHLGAQVYELSNNHLWRAGFVFRDWVSPAPSFLLPPFGGRRGGEREWVLYTLGMYYALLDCGFRLSPGAGTASGVHPVPAGFSRVYVHLEEGFSYEAWIAGLKAGRSFVTTGPMLLATLEGRDPGYTFRSDASPVSLRLSGLVLSEEPLSFVEAVENGRPVRTFFPENRKTESGAFETRFSGELVFDRTGWAAVRAWEDRPGGRFRFAHTSPWFVEIQGRPLRPRPEERDFLIARMRAELERSRSVLPKDALEEYERALSAYEKLEAFDDSAEVARLARPPAGDAELRLWLEDMVRQYRFTPWEIRAATGLSIGEIDSALRRFGLVGVAPAPRDPGAPILVLPYPGGRHPRAGFLDGAIDPQRETKIGVFAPWEDGGYVVVDVPEAILCGRGLLYLAHTHVPTIWNERGVTLERLEWVRCEDGSLSSERRFPDGVSFGSKIVPRRDGVRMELWIANGSQETLSAIRIQNCVHLKAALGFSAQTNRNKVFASPYAAARSEDGRRWIITAWDPLDRVWANPAVPCVHSDPRLPDCPPGETRRARGWLSFYEGEDVEGEFRRIEASGWRTP